MKRLTPNMAGNNVKETVNYYVDNFGFNLAMVVSDDKSSVGDRLEEGKTYVWANVMHGEVGLMFQSVESMREDVGDFFQRIGSSATLYIEVDDAEKLYREVKDRVEIHKVLDRTWYGAQEFYVRDCNGYILAFSSRS